MIIRRDRQAYAREKSLSVYNHFYFLTEVFANPLRSTVFSTIHISTFVHMVYHVVCLHTTTLSVLT